MEETFSKSGHDKYVGNGGKLLGEQDFNGDLDSY